MARSAIILSLLIIPFLSMAQVAKDTASMDPDSVFMKVFRSLTLEKPIINRDGWKHFTNEDWEALAYWEIQDNPKPEQMQEAVGDLYKFQSDSTFLIRLRDPQNPQQIGNTVTGRYRLPERKFIVLVPGNSGQPIKWPIIHLSEEYMVLEVDGLRIFFTKSLSY